MVVGEMSRSSPEFFGSRRKRLLSVSGEPEDTDKSHLFSLDAIHITVFLFCLEGKSGGEPVGSPEAECEKLFRDAMTGENFEPLAGWMNFSRLFDQEIPLWCGSLIGVPRSLKDLIETRGLLERGVDFISLHNDREH